MNTNKLLLKISLLFLLSSCSSTSEVKNLNLPETKLKNLITQEEELLKLNRHTILEFWASWCEGCSEAMASIQNKVVRKSKRVHFYPISIDEELDPALTYYNEKVKGKIKNLKGIYWDQDAVMPSHFQLDGLPKTILLDRKGKVRWEHVGGLKEKDIKKLRRMIYGTKGKKNRKRARKKKVKPSTD